MRMYSKSEITQKCLRLVHKCGVQQRKRKRLERVKAAFKDFRAGGHYEDGATSPCSPVLGRVCLIRRGWPPVDGWPGGL
jgi:hypothetical protein